MRKQVFGRKFKRDANERQALFKGLMNDLVLKETIKTTEEKAKSIKGQVEKLVTKAKKGVSARILLQPFLNEKAIEKMLTDLAPRFANRLGGYTRIIKLGSRFSDNANMAIIEWVEKKIATQESVESKTVKPAARAVIEKVEVTAKTEKTAKKEVKSTKVKTARKEKTSSRKAKTK